MDLENLRQPPFNPTFMGALRGAADHLGLTLSTPMLYGLTGHAFVMNVHETLCPSGPYCFDREPIFGLARNAGLDIEELGFFWNDGGACERGELEAQLKAALDDGQPCFLVNMEFQLVTGYDETGFLTAQPWPGHDFPQKHLTFGTWAEFHDGVHVNFNIVRRGEAAPQAEAVKAALAYAQELWNYPPGGDEKPYGMGPAAYRHWRKGVEAGHGAEHGCWWNGMVWAECRDNAAKFMTEVGETWPDAAESADCLASRYAEIAQILYKVSNKELPADEKFALLGQASEIEAGCVADLAGLAAKL